jgi:hypothetical protein
LYTIRPISLGITRAFNVELEVLLSGKPTLDGYSPLIVNLVEYGRLFVTVSLLWLWSSEKVGDQLNLPGSRKISIK